MDNKMTLDELNDKLDQMINKLDNLEKKFEQMEKLISLSILGNVFNTAEKLKKSFNNQPKNKTFKENVGASDKFNIKLTPVKKAATFGQAKFG